MRDKLIDAGTAIAANRTLASLGPVMRWASEEDLIETNIVPAIRRTPETKRERVLTKPEIRAIWRACEKLGPHEVAMNYGRMVRFLLVCAQRRDEAASMKFGDILDGTWRQIENKASRPHSIPLPPLAMDLVGQGDARDYVFGGRLGKIGGFSKLKRMLDEASGVTDWRLHDLRRSAATGMQDIGVRGDIVQAVLNHSLPGVAAVYLALRTRKAEGRGAGDLGGRAGEDRAADDAGGVMSSKDDFWVLVDNLDQPKRTVDQVAADIAAVLKAGPSRRFCTEHSPK